MTKRFHFDTILRFFLRSPRWVGESPFIGFLLLLCLALFLSAFVFYRYVFAARNVDVRSDVIQVRLDQPRLQEVIQAWQEREAKFNQIEATKIRDIFAKPEEALKKVEN